VPLIGCRRHIRSCLQAGIKITVTHPFHQDTDKRTGLANFSPISKLAFARTFQHLLRDIISRASSLVPCSESRSHKRLKSEAVPSFRTSKSDNSNAVIVKVTMATNQLPSLDEVKSRQAIAEALIAEALDYALVQTPQVLCRKNGGCPVLSAENNHPRVSFYCRQCQSCLIVSSWTPVLSSRRIDSQPGKSLKM
jgi:hypothetical protein